MLRICVLVLFLMLGGCTQNMYEWQLYVTSKEYVSKPSKVKFETRRKYIKLSGKRKQNYGMPAFSRYGIIKKEGRRAIRKEFDRSKGLRLEKFNH